MGSGSGPRSYDRFGSPLLVGLSMYATNEFRTLSPFGGSEIFKRGFLFDRLFQNLVVAQDTYDNRGTAVTVGRAVEAYYNPMMLGVLRLDGIRWDADSRRNRFSFLTSRISEPLRVFELSRPLDFVTYLYGGHWETQLGSVVRFSASYVNSHITDTLIKRGNGSFRKGTFPTNLNRPEFIYIAFSDDSPEDGFGARIHFVEMYVNSQLRQDIIPEIRKSPNAVSSGQNRRFISEQLRLEDIAHVRQRQSWLPRTMANGTNRSLASLFLLGGNLFDDGFNLDGTAEVLEASGTDIVLFRFSVPREARDISFRVLAGNDYAIDIGAAMGWGGVSGRTWNDFHSVARANGNPKDETNLQWVEFDYGMPTGLEVYGAEATLSLSGLEIRGDYSISNHHTLFPIPSNFGRRHTLDARAYSVVVGRDLNRFEFNAEIFRVPPDYQTSFFFWDDGRRLDLAEYQLVNDNDDLDPWPDSWEHEDPLSLVFQRDITKATPESRFNLNPGSLRDVGFGVVPGLDENGDGIIDTNVNDNLIPDYEEPFLMYYVESEDFVYGDDFNNNGVVDSRENDNKPDYPYERDSEGQHLFVDYDQGPNLTVTVGAHDVGQIAGPGSNRTLYAKLEYHRSLPIGLALDIYHRIKRVKDDIPDPLYQYVSNPLALGNYDIKLQSDELAFRNSWATLTFAQFKYRRIKQLNLQTTWRYALNRRLRTTFGDDEEQGEGNDWSLAVVNRADYAWEPIDNFVMTPMVKFGVRREDSSVFRGTIVDERVFAPILRADYTLTEKTVIRAGVQGLPFLKHRFRNDTASYKKFDAWHYILALQNNSSYIGYRISMNLGFRKSIVDNIGLRLQDEVETSEFFFHVRTN